jgi:hypothetical protein
MGDLKTLVSLSQQLIIAEGSLNQIRPHLQTNG